ncbi:MAG: patatin-like phospholipase family protein [Deltaproteobacteria bacterium]|nr:patatin-like phospholipase family protein [Deltaproteobacteria bacterium]
MGISIIQKIDPSTKTEPSKIALVLSGGAIAGAAFKIGGLKALNDFLLNKKITDFDIYIGLSAGAILSVPICGGIPPEEMLASLDGKSKRFTQISPYDLYYPNWQEMILRPLKFLYGHLSFLPGVLYDVLLASPKLKNNFLHDAVEYLKHPTYSNYENMTRPILKVAYSNRRIPSVGELIPSGVFDNETLSRYLRLNMEKNKMSNNFRVLKRMTGKSLYITAMDLDTSKRVVFGHDEKNDVDISEAAQASSAIPVFYKPARIKGVDYIDGGVRKTAHIDLAYEKGASLIICYNPFRPYNNQIFLEYLREDNKYITKNKRLSDYGLGTIINQVFRTLFQSRLQQGLRSYQSDANFKADVIVIEPAEDDSDFFTMNPLFFWNRAKAAKRGFDSVTEHIGKEYDKIAKIMATHGVQMTREVINKDLSRINESSQDDSVIMEVLEQDQKQSKKFKVLHGGRR